MVCPSQTAALVRIPLIGQATTIISPVLGWLVDRYGAPTGFVFLVVTYWLGWILVTITSAATTHHPRIDPLLYVAFVLVSLATWMGGLLTVQTGLYFTGITRGRVIFALNALFDAGSVTYLALWAIDDAWSVGLTAVAAGFLVLSVVILGSGLFFWSVAVPDQEEEREVENQNDQDDDDDNDNDDGDNDDNHSVAVRNDENEENVHPHPEAVNGTGMARDESNQVELGSVVRRREERNLKSANGCQTSHTSTDTMARRLSEQLTTSPRPDTGTSSGDLAISTESDLYGSDSLQVQNYTIVAERNKRQQLLSAPFLFMCVFFGIHSASSQWNMATQRDFLAYLGDNTDGNQYLSIFTLIMPMSILAMPFGDAIVQRFGYVAALHTINVLAVGYTLIKLLSTNLKVQVAGFVIFAFFRSFLYGISFGFFPTFLAGKVTGLAVGISFLIMGVFGLVGIPLASLAVERFHGNFFIPNCVYAGGLVPAILATLGIGRSMKLEKAAKARKRIS